MNEPTARMQQIALSGLYLRRIRLVRVLTRLDELAEEIAHEDLAGALTTGQLLANELLDGAEGIGSLVEWMRAVEKEQNG